MRAAPRCLFADAAIPRPNTETKNGCMNGTSTTRRKKVAPSTAMAFTSEVSDAAKAVTARPK